MKKRLFKFPLIILVSCVIVALDQISKIWARNALIPNIPTPFIPNLIQLRLVKNTGAAFSLFSNSTFFLGFLSFIVAIFLLWWLFQSSPNLMLKGMAGSFLLGGTIGNGIDRWFHSEVTDFLELIPINFPIFNIADISINLAILFLALNTLTIRHGHSPSSIQK